MTSEVFERSNELRERASEMGVTLSDRQLEQFLLYYDLLLRWNEKMNLTAITEWKDVLEKHFLDSLTLAISLPSHAAGLRMIDIGTGAGFPGVPLKIAFPEIEVTLADTLNKRVGFLNEVISMLELTGVSAVHSRAEDLAREPAYRMTYDLAVSRAVAALPVLLEYCTPFLKVGGEFVAYKTDSAYEEIDRSAHALEELSCSVSGISIPQIPGTDLSRVLIHVRRDQEVDSRYPRRAGMPEKKPL
ncbi:MAG: 16S rRNA (guanine(527)-N(7))-methyltransferase RsmG [Lachnospiraceae bacterium]|nr:16S rRNA (guanine(527)-N(7))-methyltransferase RsmG [Lachnospiraceae bacterium]MBQ1414751.1 16S rRNA (guanine(527)-N(7))-methyltransferase RsmG [Lachnospiraceae bacterium]MBQ1514508.1 16S rRNA (guanine(527)-N(7))-methyltransferase RsmG [Lachnospiraceae bacterium]MBQ4309025.1 16S rRNA (guanine(527)-N(7))-methyltransferase RsmG [Lachnospiraceae bacterium]